jgi:hypothetical protein
MLAAYQRGGVQVITNCMVLTEGTDLPRTGCILHAKPTKSATLYEQMTGRGLRTYPGKSDCIVLDLVDIARKHSLQTARRCSTGCRRECSSRAGSRASREELEALREVPRGDRSDVPDGRRFTLEELRDRASTFDVWAIPDRSGRSASGRCSTGSRSGRTIYRLQYPWSDGSETLEVSPNLIGKWQVVCTLRPHGTKEQPRPAPRQRTIVDGLDEPLRARQTAEAFVCQQRPSVAKMKQPDAPWRQAKASEKQLALLAKWRIPHDPKTVTRGRASDLLDLASSRRR